MAKFALLLTAAVCCLCMASAEGPATNHTSTSEGEELSAGVEFLRYLAIVLLVLCGAMFSGLTLGIMGLDTNQLQVRCLSRMLVTIGNRWAGNLVYR